MAVPGKAAGLLKEIINTLVSVTCRGEYVSSLYGCVSNGEVCSNHGSCDDHQCTCDKDYEGTFCEAVVGSDSSSSNAGTIIGIVIGETLSQFDSTLLLLNLKCEAWRVGSHHIHVLSLGFFLC